MKITHPLPPATVEQVRETLRLLETRRRDYLAALGAAKEIEIEVGAIRAALSQQLAIEEAAGGLPKPIGQYLLSADGSALVGETADAPAAEVPAVVAPPAAVEKVNGKHASK